MRAYKKLNYNDCVWNHKLPQRHRDAKRQRRKDTKTQRHKEATTHDARC